MKKIIIAVLILLCSNLLWAQDNKDTLKNFILPGGKETAAILHLARTVCRRAERETVALSNVEKINHEIIVYLNRLSDLLFVLARFENYSSHHPEIEWKRLRQ